MPERIDVCAIGYLVKPHRPEELLPLIATTLAGRESR
jgi:hypothetical protein